MGLNRALSTATVRVYTLENNLRMVLNFGTGFEMDVVGKMLKLKGFHKIWAEVL